MFFRNFNEFAKKRKEGVGIFNSSNTPPSTHAREFSFVDLCLLPKTSGRGKEKQNSNSNKEAGEPPEHPFQYDPTHTRVRADVGWIIRDDAAFDMIVRERQLKFPDGTPIKGDDFRNALKLTNKSFYLNMVEHDLSFNPDGSVEIKIQYRAYIESVLKTTHMDALTTPHIAHMRKIKAEEYKKVIDEKICSETDYVGTDGTRDENDEDALQQLLAQYDAISDAFLREAHRSMLDRIIQRERFYYCYLSLTDANDFRRQGYFSGQPELFFDLGSMKGSFNKPKDPSEPYGQAARRGEDVEELTYSDTTLEKYVEDETFLEKAELINFFYLGDIVHVALDCLHKPHPDQYGRGDIKAHMRNTKMLLTSFTYLNAAMEPKDINIAEIPISAEFFFEWMTKNVTRPMRRSYPVVFFVRDLCNKLIVELLGEVCLNKQLEKKLRFNTYNFLGEGVPSDAPPDGVGAVTGLHVDPFAVFSILKSRYTFPNTSKINISQVYKDNLLPLKSSIDTYNSYRLGSDYVASSMAKMYSYFCIYAVTTVTVHNGTGKQYDDGMKGTYHVQIGADRGLVKSYSFEKTDIQFIREARYFNRGHDGLLQLGAVYKVKLEMFGNTIFYPGMEIFIDPRGIGGDDWDPTKKDSVGNKLGIGGYHLVTKVDANIEPGKFSTTVEAQFVYSGDGNGKAYAVGATTQPEDKAIEDLPSNDELIGETVGDAAETFCEKLIVVNTRRIRDIEKTGTTELDENLALDEDRLDDIISD